MSTVCIAVAALTAYLAIAPTVIAQQYMANLAAQLTTVQAALKKSAESARLPLFEDPDVSLSDRQAQLDTSKQNIASAERTLDNFAHNQLTWLPGAALNGDYHTADVRRQQAQNIVPQSKQVLEDYSRLEAYIYGYTLLQIKLDGHLGEVNKISDFNALIGKNEGMAQTAASVRGDLAALAKLNPPADFSRLQTEALATFTQAANSFDQLASGLGTGADSRIYSAIRQLEIATNKNQVADKNTLVTVADQSVTLQQLADLPEKLENVQGR